MTTEPEKAWALMRLFTTGVLRESSGNILVAAIEEILAGLPTYGFVLVHPHEIDDDLRTKEEITDRFLGLDKALRHVPTTDLSREQVAVALVDARRSELAWVLRRSELAWVPRDNADLEEEHSNE